MFVSLNLSTFISEWFLVYFFGDLTSFCHFPCCVSVLFFFYLTIFLTHLIVTFIFFIHFSHRLLIRRFFFRRFPKISRFNLVSKPDKKKSQTFLGGFSCCDENITEFFCVFLMDLIDYSFALLYHWIVHFFSHVPVSFCFLFLIDCISDRFFFMFPYGCIF